jgi:hypothetical protein
MQTSSDTLCFTVTPYEDYLVHMLDTRVGEVADEARRYQRYFLGTEGKEMKSLYSQYSSAGQGITHTLCNPKVH